MEIVMVMIETCIYKDDDSKSHLIISPNIRPIDKMVLNFGVAAVFHSLDRRIGSVLGQTCTLSSRLPIPGPYSAARAL
jgi:hypothetical protein